MLYTRLDAFRRRMASWDILAPLFDVVVHDLTTLSFEDQFRLLSDASHFVAPEGAYFTSTVVMKPSARVLDIGTVKPSSWAELFGSAR